MSMKVIIQPNPFKVEYEIKEYQAQKYTIRELFDLQDTQLDIENCAIILNDKETTNYDIIPFEDDTLIIKALPLGEGGELAWNLIKSTAVGAYTGFKLGGVIGAVAGGIIGFTVGAIAASFYDDLQPIDASFSMDGKQNTGEQYSIVPVVYGTTKMTPSFGGNDYTTTVGTGETADVYLHQLYILGYQPTILEELYIRNSLAVKRVRDTFTATTSGNDIIATNRFTDVKVGMRVLIESESNYGEYTVTYSTPNSISVDKALTNTTESITFSYLANTGIYNDLEIEFRYDGSMPNNYPHQVTQASLNQSCLYDSPVTYTTPASVKNAYVNIGFLSGLVSVDSKNKLNKTTVKYRIEYKTTTSTTWKLAGNYSSTGGVREAYRKELVVNFPSIDTYDIRVTRTTADNIGTGISDAMTLVSVRTYKLDSEGNKITPIQENVAKNLVIMALKIKATKQLSGSISNVQTVVTRWVKDYDPTIVSANPEDKWVVRESHNPASMYIDALTNPLLSQYPIPFNDLHFNFDTLIDFYEWSAGNNNDVNPDGSVGVEYTCNGLLSQETTLHAELKNILGVARGQFALVDGKYTVIHDIPRTTPIQMFTARNMLADSFSATRNYEEIPDSVEVTFVDKEATYTTNTVQVPTTTTDIKATPVTLAYVDNYPQAYALGKYIFNSSLLQDRAFMFTVQLDALVATRGDRVLVQHDAALLGLASGRVKSVNVVGGLVASIDVDEICTMELGTNYGLVVRLEDGINRYKLVTHNGDTNTLILDESVPEGEILEGDLFSFGIADAEVVDCLITDITYDDTLNARITAVIYDENMYDLGQIPVWESGLTITDQKSPRVDISTYGDVDATLSQLIETQNNTTSVKIFQVQPTTSYNEGDLWVAGSSLYDCITAKTVSGVFEQSDWRLRGSSAFDMLNKDTFNEPTPEHRWQQIGGNTLPYNLLQTTDYEVTDGETTKSNLLTEDDTDWESLDSLSAVTVDAEGLQQVIAKGNMDTANIVGRYGISGYMGQAYTNLLVSPNAPTSQSVVLSAGNVVIQCYRGTISCSYGTASYGNPLVFTTAGETLALTMTDTKYGMVTQTTFIPPYVEDTFTANSDTATISSTALQLYVNITNIPSEGMYGMLRVYGDADNYINLHIANNLVYIYINAGGTSYTDTLEITSGDYVFALDWSSALTFSINSVAHLYTEVGDVYGFNEFDSYGFDDNDSYGMSDEDLVFTTDLTDVTIGKVDTNYFNNVVTQIEEI